MLDQMQTFLNFFVHIFQICFDFFRFPKNIERRNIWFALLGFEESKITRKRAFLCSNHFDETNFFYRMDGVKVLKDDALPKPFVPMLYEDFR